VLREDISLGLAMAQTLSQHSVGQTVIVKDKMILALEAIEGTDACVKRGIALGNGGIIVCKAAHADQNRKFDLPTLGPASLAGIKKGDISCIAWLSHSTFIADLETFKQKARELDIVLVSY
jgi:DUF1009 family protein